MRMLDMMTEVPPEYERWIEKELPMKQRACYIAGPMRGIPEYNYPAFMDAERRLIIYGWKVYNPASMDMDLDATDYPLRSLTEQKEHDDARSARHFAVRDLAILTRTLRAENGDAIVVLPGWNNSEGAVAEHAVARWVKLQLLTLQEALDDGKTYDENGGSGVNIAHNGCPSMDPNELMRTPKAKAHLKSIARLNRKVPPTATGPDEGGCSRGQSNYRPCACQIYEECHDCRVNHIHYVDEVLTP